MVDGQRPGRRGGLSFVDGGPGPTTGGPGSDSATPPAGGFGASEVHGDESLAPVIPLFGGSRSAAHPAGGHASSSSASARDTDSRFGRRLAGHPVEPDVDRVDSGGRDDPQDDDVRERAEALLLRKLRSRSLSISEARTAIREVPGTDEVVITELIERFIDLGYLNDAVFAEQLVLSAVERRGEGRRAVATTLMKRGIPRDIADAAIAEMPDDDAERALDFARSKARSVGGKDDDAALRRLAGQLARRGYPSSVALSAARQALREVGVGRSRPSRPSSGVRFTPDE